jgi:AraC-like DNA-binding protein
LRRLRSADGVVALARGARGGEAPGGTGATGAWEVPALAIEAFEALSGLTIVVHDIGGHLGPRLRPEQSYHTNPFCEAVKDSGYDPVCSDVDWLDLHPQIAEEPEGRIKICPAGLVECVAPVLVGGKLAAVLYAGVGRPAPDLVERCRTPMLPADSIRWPIEPPELVGEEEAQFQLECLRQLAARLQIWWAETAGRVDGAWYPVGAHTDTLARYVQIRSFVRSYHTQAVTLRDLAADLHLSPSRAAHVIRAACGVTFGQLLASARLTTAIALLRRSALPVLEVAMLSGFGDVSHFHRTFKAHTGMTPQGYREVYQHEQKPVLSDAAARRYVDRIPLDGNWQLPEQARTRSPHGS